METQNNDVVEVDGEQEEQLTVEIPSEIRAGAASNPSCGLWIWAAVAPWPE